MVVSSQDADHVVFESPNKHVRCEITYNPLHVSFYIDSELKLTLNDKNLFYFEVTRQKPTSAGTSSTSVSTNPPPTPKETKEIVDYTEAGKAIYADGTIEGETEETEELCRFAVSLTEYYSAGKSESLFRRLNPLTFLRLWRMNSNSFYQNRQLFVYLLSSIITNAVKLHPFCCFIPHPTSFFSINCYSLS